MLGKMPSVLDGCLSAPDSRVSVALFGSLET